MVHLLCVSSAVGVSRVHVAKGNGQLLPECMRRELCHQILSCCFAYAVHGVIESCNA